MIQHLSTFSCLRLARLAVCPAGLSFVNPKGVCMALCSKAHRCVAVYVLWGRGGGQQIHTSLPPPPPPPMTTGQPPREGGRMCMTALTPLPAGHTWAMVWRGWPTFRPLKISFFQTSLSHFLMQALNISRDLKTATEGPSATSGGPETEEAGRTATYPPCPRGITCTARAPRNGLEQTMGKRPSLGNSDTQCPRNAQTRRRG